VTKDVTVYTWGYSKRTPNDLERVMYQYDIQYIIDVRARPGSRKPGWNKAKLEEKFGPAYIWAQCFGNASRVAPENWRPGDAGMSDIAPALADVIRVGMLGNVLLLCLEQDPEKCHRSAVAEFIGCKTIHLEVPDGTE